MTTTPAGGDTYTLNAQDDARVEAQIGVVHGDANFYRIAGEASPEEKYQVGRNYLNGNMPRRAEQLIQEAYVGGHRLTEVPYHWALAILSNRSFDHLTETEFDQLGEAFAAVEEHQPDEWIIALGVVAQLLQSLAVQEQQPDGRPQDFDAALARYAELPPARCDEIRRHLEMVLVGGIQDRLQAQDAAEVAAKRMGDGRRERVWKFFEPKPAPPRMTPLPDADPAGRDLAVLAGGVALGGSCGYLGSDLLVGDSVPLFVLALLLHLGGGYLVVRYDLERRSLAARRDWAAGRLRAAHPTDASVVPRQRGQQATRFATDVRRWIDQRFTDQYVDSGRDRATWWTESAALRSALAGEIVEQHTGHGPPPQVGALDWLIRWHAESAFRAWQDGSLFEQRTQLATPVRVSTGSAAGAVALVAGFIAVAVNAVGSAPVSGLFTAAVWCAAVVLVWRGGAAVHTGFALHRYRSTTLQRRLLDENAAFARWQKVLEDRPTDARMAAWLDFDKAHIKAAAMAQYGLANRDLIAHVALTGPAPVSREARVLYGPPRFSRYEVQLFLLTDAGVRQVTVELEMDSGTLANERRQAFRYDAITSAAVHEVGIRIDGLRKQVVGRPEAAGNPGQGSDKIILAQQFQLTLNSAQSLDLLVGNVDEGLIDKMREDASHLLELTKDTSGVAAALRILEAVAAEGSEWVKQERLRRQRRIIDYQRKRSTRLALGRAADAPTPPLGLPPVPRQLR